MKTYMIVTNDDLELPISVEIVGAEAVAEKLGMSVSTLRWSLCRGFSKRRKYKAVIVKDKQIADKKQYLREYYKRYNIVNDRTEHIRRYRQRKKEEAMKCLK